MKWAAVLLAVICLGIAAFFGLKILQTEHDYREGINAYEQMAEIATGSKSRDTDESEGPGAIPAPSSLKVTGPEEHALEDQEDSDSADVTDLQEKDEELSGSGSMTCRELIRRASESFCAAGIPVTFRTLLPRSAQLPSRPSRSSPRRSRPHIPASSRRRPPPLWCRAFFRAEDGSSPPC